MNQKSVIFLGSNICIERFVEMCEENGFSTHGIIDDDYYRNTDIIDGVPVIGDEKFLRQNLQDLKEKFVFFLAVNWLPMSDDITVRNRKKRHYWIDVIKELELECINIISKRAKVYSSASIGKNVFIGDFVTIEPRVIIEDFVSIWEQGIVGHDNRIGKNSVLQRNVTVHSCVDIGENVFMGLSSRVCSRAVISNGSWIHSGVLMFRGTTPDEIVRIDRGNTRRLSAYLDQPDHKMSD